MNIGTLTGQIALEDQLSNKLTLMSSYVQKFSDGFTGMAGAVAIGAGAITAAAVGAAISIVALGEKGSTILGVEEAFNRLAVAAGSTGEILIGALSEGVRGTVDSMVLMRSTTRLLSSGLKVSAEDLSLMAKVSREMGKATGTDAADGLNILTQAIMSGNARGLKRYGIQLDLVSAEKQFRAAVGNSSDALSAAGKLEVNRIAVMAAAKVKLDQYGESQLSFKERVQQATTAVGNWFDNLAKGVASSPAVNKAFDTISESITKAFGGSSQTILQTLLGWVDRFANAVTKWAPVVINWVANIVKGVTDFYNKVLAYWDTVPDWFKNIAKQAAVTAGVVYLSSEAMKGLAGATNDTLSTGASFATMVSGTRDTMLSAVEAQRAWGGAIKGYILGLVAVIPLIRQTGIYTSIVALATTAWTTAMGSSFVTGIVGVGTAIGAFLVSPVVLVIAGIAALVGGLRLLTGSWNFILTPIRIAWQALKDVWTIGAEIVSIIGRQLKPVLEDIGAVFSWAGGIIANQFNMALADARRDLFSLWELLKQVGPLKDVITSLKLLHAIAERVRGPVAAAVDTGKGPKKEDVNLSYTPPAPAPLPGGGPALFASTAAEDYAAKLKEVNKRIAEYTAGSTVLTAANKSAVLSYTELGLSADDIAIKLKKPAIAVQAYIEELDRMKMMVTLVVAVQKDWAKQTHETVTALADDFIKTQKEQADASGAAQSAQLAMAVDYQERNKQVTMSGTALKLRQIDLEQAAALSSVKSQVGYLGVLTVEQTKYYQHQRDLANNTSGTIIERMRAAGVATQADLDETARVAWKDYADMAASSGIWSKEAIQHQKDVAIAAGHAADGTKSVWEKTYSALGNVADILDNISGKFAEVGSMAAKGAQAVMANLAEGNWVGAIISGTTAAIGIITKLVGWANEGRKAVVAFAESFDTLAAGTGFDELHKRLEALGTAGEAMWKKLTQMTKKGDLAGAKRVIAEITAALEFTPEGFGYKTVAELQAIADKTKAVYEYMVTSGKYTAAAIADAFQKSKDAQISALGDEAGAHQKALDNITKRYDEMFSAIDSRYKTLSDSVAKEAEEAVMGVIETQERAEMVRLEGERALLEEKKRMELLSAEETYAAWLEAGKTADQALRELFAKGYDSPIRFHPEEIPFGRDPEYMAAGGVVPFRPRGTDTVPAMLTPGETVTPAGRSRTPIIIPVTVKTQRNEVLAREVVRAFVEAGL